MVWIPIALFAVPILATLWALGLGVMAVRQKDLLERILCGGLALAGMLVAAGGWLLLGWVLGGGAGRFAGLAMERPRMTEFGWFYFAVLGALVVVVVVRRWRLRISHK
jgi:hypothetical protein